MQQNGRCVMLDIMINTFLQFASVSVLHSTCIGDIVIIGIVFSEWDYHVLYECVVLGVLFFL